MLLLSAGTCNAQWFGDYRKQLLYSDVIVRGVIDSIGTEFVREATYWRDTDHPDRDLAITRLKIRVTDVLRGSVSESSITVVAPGAFPPGVPNPSNTRHSLYGFTFDFEVGREVIYCLWHDPAEGGVLMVPPNEGRFRREQGRWLKEGANSEYLTLHDIQSVIAETEIENVLEESDLVVEGEVLEVVSDRKDDWSPVTETITMNMVQVWKGRTRGDTVRFSVERKSGPDRIHAPKLEEGDSYVVFMKRDGDRLLPFAGVNGMFEVQGDELIRNNAVTVTMRKSQLIQLLSKGQNDEE